MAEFLTCECGCDVFESLLAVRLERNDFRVYRFKQSIPVAYDVLNITRCIMCNRIHLPDVSITGRNVLDGDVAAYKALIDWAEKANSRISTLEELMLDKIFKSEQKEEDQYVQAEPVDETDSKESVRRGPGGSGPRKGTKK